jgi:hypothetical protein
VLDDLADAKASEWAAQYDRSATIAIFDSNLMASRQSGTLVCRLTSASKDMPSRKFIERFRAEMFRGLGLACHGLTTEEIAEFFVRFMNRRGYRGFDRFR